jgi:hypothetical protein
MLLRDKYFLWQKKLDIYCTKLIHFEGRVRSGQRISWERCYYECNGFSLVIIQSNSENIYHTCTWKTFWKEILIPGHALILCVNVTIHTLDINFNICWEWTVLVWVSGNNQFHACRCQCLLLKQIKFMHSNVLLFQL